MRKDERESFQRYMVKLAGHDERLNALGDQMLRKFDEFQNLVSHTESRIRANTDLVSLMSQRLDSTDGLILQVVNALDEVRRKADAAAKRKRTKKGRWPKSRRRK